MAETILGSAPDGLRAAPSRYCRLCRRTPFSWARHGSAFSSNSGSVLSGYWRHQSRMVRSETLNSAAAFTLPISRARLAPWTLVDSDCFFPGIADMVTRRQYRSAGPPRRPRGQPGAFRSPGPCSNARTATGGPRRRTSRYRPLRVRRSALAGTPRTSPLPLHVNESGTAPHATFAITGHAVPSPPSQTTPVRVSIMNLT